MAALILILFLVAVFHREMIFLICWILTGARKLPSGDWDLEISARKIRMQVWLSSSASALESCSMNIFWTEVCFVSEELWNEWSTAERNAYLLWSHSIHLKVGLLERLFLFRKIEIIDRDAVLTTTEPLSFIDALEKAAEYRNRKKDKISQLWGWFGGISLIGHPVFEKWPEVSERLKSLSFVLDRLR